MAAATATTKPKRTRRGYTKVDQSKCVNFSHKNDRITVPHYITTHGEYAFQAHNLGEQRTLLGLAMTDSRMINWYHNYSFIAVNDGAQCLSIVPNNGGDNLIVYFTGGKNPCVLDQTGTATGVGFDTVEDFTLWVVQSLDTPEPAPQTDYETVVKEGADAAVAALTATETAAAAAAPAVQYRLVPAASA